MFVTDSPAWKYPSDCPVQSFAGQAVLGHLPGQPRGERRDRLVGQGVLADQRERPGDRRAHPAQQAIAEPPGKVQPRRGRRGDLVAAEATAGKDDRAAAQAKQPRVTRRRHGGRRRVLPVRLGALQGAADIGGGGPPLAPPPDSPHVAGRIAQPGPVHLAQGRQSPCEGLGREVRAEPAAVHERPGQPQQPLLLDPKGPRGGVLRSSGLLSDGIGLLPKDVRSEHEVIQRADPARRRRREQQHQAQE